MKDVPMIIDSFAGGGGASTGIEAVLGRSPDVAINHNAAALALHEANHPETLHLDSNIWDVEPREVTKGRHVGLLWASPDCKHFSKAKGGAPRDRNIRDLVWVVVKWAEEVRPDVICMENVEEFVTWGPVGEDGQPIKELAGVTFDLWIKRLKRAGYRVQWRELRACDFGAPTIRKRWFLVARCDGRQIRWPKPTHGDPKSPEVRKGKLFPWRTAAECIDRSLPCPSIFDTGAEITRKVLAWRISSTLEADFCVEALNEAIHKFGPPEIMNTDQGSQFTSFAWTDRLKRIGTRISMDGKGRGLDNIFIERLWRSLKYECVYLHAWETGSQARAGVGRWVTFYNHRRPNTAHGGQPPAVVYFNHIATDQQVQAVA